MITKTTLSVIFNLQNSRLLTLPLPTKEIFQVNGQNRPVANQPYSLPTEAMFLVIQSNRYMSKLSCTGFIFVCESFFVPAPFNLKPRVKIVAKGALAMPICNIATQPFSTVSFLFPHCDLECGINRQ